METTPFSQEAVPPPPPSFTPPPVISPPPPKPRKSRGWMIVSIILILLLGLSWLIIIAQGVSHAIGSGLNRGFKTSSARDISPKLEECLLEDTDARSKTAVIGGEGIIASHSADPSGNNMVDVIKAQL